MILFSERLRLQKEYEQWLKQQEYEIKDCTMNTLVFLIAKGLINEDEVHRHCGNEKLIEKPKNLDTIY